VNPLIYFLLFLKASFFSTGGLGNLPSLHQDLIANGWAVESQFTQAIAVGQISPGPNGLWTISIGFLTLGYLGALLALLAISIPPFTIFALDAVHQQLQGRPAVKGFMRGVTLAVSGLSFVVAILLTNNPDMADWKAWIIAIGAFCLAATGRINSMVIVLIAAVVGYLCYGL
jgi:chromate transporter